MHRKIPKRHRVKVKAVPSTTPDERPTFRSSDQKANNPPKNPYDQEVPRRINEVLNGTLNRREKWKNQRNKYASKGKAESKHDKKKNAKPLQLMKPGQKKKHQFEIVDDEAEVLEGCTRPLQSVPTMKKLTGETQKEFLNRIEQISKAVILQSQLEDKFNAEIVTDKSGKFTMQKRQIGDLEGFGFEDKVGKRKKKDTGADSDDEPEAQRKTKKQKNKERRMGDGYLKRLKKLEKLDEFDEFTDHVKFGDVVHRPPEFTNLPKQSKFEHKDFANRRPGQSKNLLMVKTGRSAEKASKKLGGKQTKLGVHRRRVLDEERDRVVSAYKAMKANKMAKINEGRNASF